MGKNKFEQTKAEKDMRASARETEEWLRSQNKEFKRKKPAPIPAPAKESSTKNPVVTLSKSKYFGETTDKFIEIQRKKGIHVDDGMRFSAGPQERIDAKEPAKEEVKPKKEDNGADIGDFGNWFGFNAAKGITGFKKDLAATANALFPEEVFGENNIVNRVYDHYSKLEDHYGAQAKKASEKIGGKGWEHTGNIVSLMAGIAPDAVAGLMSFGTSMAGKTITAVDDIARYGYSVTDDFLDATERAWRIWKENIKNPEFVMSFARNYGSSYEAAKSKGANDMEASGAAFLTSSINGTLDTSSPDLVNKFLQYKEFPEFAQNFGKILDGGLTGVFQGSIEPSVSNAIYNDADLFSMEDENAVFNPSRMINDFTTGVATKSVGMAFDNSSDKSGDLTVHKNNKTKKSTLKADSKPFKARMNEVRKRLNQKFSSNSSLYGEEKAFEILTNEWNDYLNRLSDEDFDEYIKIMKGE